MILVEATRSFLDLSYIKLEKIKSNLKTTNFDNYEEIIFD